ncbi:Crp/Fnr family transcriptional regulator [Bacillus sp. DNRA2]|uniref:Crp/Fnr family transcriptional regulator n=1 Tax=Bacillus sp. DNRA2 TaxID=2723053 RepID=UPI00145D6E60|nr:Crp/Fnr family transcriptional regulator [Bacillus sp. DNRA2]NMD68753.1 Crp/Fnr family transcriptional regulator [Bacillus sp. DNRA2]
MKQSIFSLFPFLEDLTAEELRQLIFIEAKAGQIIMNEGEPCHQAAFVVEGELIIQKTNKNGREINLFRVTSGQACILSITSTLSEQPFPAQTVTTKNSKLFLVDQRLLTSWMNKYASFQKLINLTTANRFNHVMGLFDDLCFRRIDERMAEYLLEKLPIDHTILYITHEELASELGTAREVVSRLMNQLEKNDILRLSRGKVMMYDRKKLKGLLTKR